MDSRISFSCHNKSENKTTRRTVGGFFGGFISNVSRIIKADRFGSFLAGRKEKPLHYSKGFSSSGYFKLSAVLAFALIIFALVNFSVVIADTPGGGTPCTMRITTSSPLSPGKEGTYYSQTLFLSASSSCKPPYVWSLRSGALPAGLTLSTDFSTGNGVIRGTPSFGSAGTYTFTVAVRDSAEALTEVTKTFTLVIAPYQCSLAIATPSLPAGTIGSSYSATIDASVTSGACASPYVWSIASGTLPPGLSFSTTTDGFGVTHGRISGTPTATGSYSFVVQVRDAVNRAQATKSYTVNINQPCTLMITTPSPLASGTAGTSYSTSLSMTSSGICGSSYTWSIASGTLPPGLSLSTTGTISGTPTAPGPYAFTVQLQDNLGNTASQPYNLYIASSCVLTITSSTPLPDARQNNPYSAVLAMSQSGSCIAPIVWSIYSGALPPGLTLVSNGVISGTPTTVGSYLFTVQVQDSFSTPAIARKAFAMEVIPAASANTCKVRTSCLSGETAVASMYGVTDSHMRGDTSGAYKVCCPYYYSGSYQGGTPGCSATDAIIVNADVPQDSNVNQPTSVWNAKVCLIKPGDIETPNDCRIKAVCGSSELCVASIYSTTDAHAAECDTYSNNICCCPSGYRWDPNENGGLGACVKDRNYCADMPHSVFYCGQPGTSGEGKCNPPQYSECCLNKAAVPGADYSIWETVSPSVVTAGQTIKVCNENIDCGAGGGLPDGVCPESIVPGFTCDICDADCSGALRCNGEVRGGDVCDASCQPRGPLVSVGGIPAECTNEDLIASVICESTGGVACDGTSYRLKFYQTNPGACSTNYGDYNLPGGAVISSYGWVCAAAKNTAGSAGFSAPVVSNVDKVAPEILAYCEPATNVNPPAYPMNATVMGLDAGCGAKNVTLYDNGAERAVSLSFSLFDSSLYSYGPHTLTAVVYDKAGNTNSGFVCRFTSDNAPIADPVFKVSGECNPGEAITIGCHVIEPDQAPETLFTQAWAGTCSKDNPATPEDECFESRNWAYLLGDQMNWDSNVGAYTKSFVIDLAQPIGTGVPATCLATDELGISSNWGDRYPLCYVGETLCNPPSFGNITITPDPVGVGTVTIKFDNWDTLAGNPGVRVTPNGMGSYRSAAFVSKVNNNYTYSYNVLLTDPSGPHDVLISGSTSMPGCTGTSFGSFTVSKPAPTTTILCTSGGVGPASCDGVVFNDNVDVSFFCEPYPGSGASCDKTMHRIGTTGGFGEYDSALFPAPAFTLSECGAPTVFFYSSDTIGNAEALKNQTIMIAKPECDMSLPMSFRFEPQLVTSGALTYGKISCNFVISGQVATACTPANTNLQLTVDSRNYITEEGLQNLNGHFRYDLNAWVVRVDTNRYRSTATATATYTPAGITNSASASYTVTGAPTLDIDIIFPDVESLRVPLTPLSLNYPSSPNFTRSMPIKFLAKGSVTTSGGSFVCREGACTARYNITLENSNPAGYTPMGYDAFDVGYKGNYNSSNLLCDEWYDLNVEMTATGVATDTATKKFFISCVPRLIVTPLESRMTLGEKNKEAFEATILNPTDALITYSLKMDAVDEEDKFILAGLTLEGEQTGTHTATGIVVPAKSSVVKKVWLNNAGAFRAGSFKLIFEADDNLNFNKHISINYLLVFAVGLDEFALWQLAVLGIFAALIFYRYENHDLMKKVKKSQK